jgi:hypothetical protein
MHLQQSSFLSVLDFAYNFESRIKGDLVLSSPKIIYLWKHYLVWGNHACVDEIQCLVDYITDPQTGKNWDQNINQVKPKDEVSCAFSNQIVCYII